MPVEQRSVFVPDHVPERNRWDDPDFGPSEYEREAAEVGNAVIDLQRLRDMLACAARYMRRGEHDRIATARTCTFCGYTNADHHSQFCKSPEVRGV